MTRFALLAMVLVLAGACATEGGDNATQDTSTPVVAPTPADTVDTLGQDTMRDTTDTATTP